MANKAELADHLLSTIGYGRGEPFAPNWRSKSPLYAGEAVGPFHVWPHEGTWGVFNCTRLIVGAPSKAEALRLMMDIHSEWISAPVIASAPDPVRPPTLCYFIGSIDGPIKIGASARPDYRLRDIQAANAYPLTILALADGGFATETGLHKRFAAHRLQGEWFERHPDILAEIDRLNNRATNPRQRMIALSMNAKDLRYAY